MKKVLILMFLCIIVVVELCSCGTIKGLHTCVGYEMVALESTCGEDGEMFLVCETCFDVLDRYPIPATGEHTFGEKIYEEGEFESCDERPYTQSCTTCGHTDTGKGGLEAHIFETVETVAPTCSERGYDKKICTVCGVAHKDNYTETIAHKLGEEYQCDETFHWLSCENCSYIRKEQHEMNRDGVCITCGNELESTPGVSYILSEDMSYATVIRYSGIYSTVKIMAEYRGVPVTHIGDSAFANMYNNVNKVVFPDSITHIGKKAFSDCYSLKVDALPPNLEYIGDEAFMNCGELTISHIPDKVTYLGKKAFKNCYRLGDITIGDSLTHIGDEAFAFCNNLGTVIFGESVVSVGKMAFYSSGINEVIISDSTTTLGTSAFSICNISKIHIGKSLGDFGDSNLNLTGSLSEITLNEENEYFALQNGMLYSKDKTKIVLVPKANVGEELTIPEGVTVIGNRAFYGAYHLKTLNLPDSLRTIEDSAFFACNNLETINFGEGLEEIGDGAFSSCAMLKEIHFPDSLKTIGASAFSDTGFVHLAIPDHITVLGEYAFGSCNDLLTVTVGSGVEYIPKRCFAYCTYLQKAIISDGVETIGNGAFESCYSLLTVSFGNNVKVIEERAFINCNSIGSIIVGTGLEEIKTDAFNNCTAIRFIYYMGTAEQWENVIIGTGNTEVNYHFRVYEYSETKPEGEGRFWHYDESGNPVKW